MKDILLVEDDITLAMGMEYSLSSEGYDIDIAKTFIQGKKFIDEKDYKLIILDVGLPDGNGFDLCKYIRTKGDVPVIFLTAEDEEVNIVMGLDIGADDYITKPFRIKELMSRIKAILRRSNALKSDSILKSKDLTLNRGKTKLYKNSTLIQLTPSEYKILLMFMENPEITLSRTNILENLWDVDGNFVDDNSLSVYIKRLREKIEDNPSKPEYIKTIRGRGYLWNYKVGGE